MIKKTKDGFKPTLDSIYKKYNNGEYDHDIESTIAVLLDKIDGLTAVVSKLQAEADKWFSRVMNKE